MIECAAALGNQRGILVRLNERKIPLLLTERGIKGERCLKPPSIYRAFRGVVAWERIRIAGTWEHGAHFHDGAENAHGKYAPLLIV